MAPRRSEDGYVLIATLVVLAIVSLVAASAAIRMQSLSDSVFASVQQAEAEQAIASETARQLYVLATTPRAPCGLAVGAPLSDDPFARFVLPGECLAFDGSWRKGADAAGLSFTDRTSLLSVNAPPTAAFLAAYRDLTGGLGDASALQALHDYVDGDEVAGEFGAERRAYYVAGKPAPRNAPLLTPYEIVNVRGWERAATPGWLAVFGDAFGPTINVNAARSPVLQFGLGLSAPEAEAAIAYARQGVGIVSANDLSQILSRRLELSPTQASYEPSRTTRLRIAAPGAPVREIGVSWVSEANDGLWRVDYSMTAPSSLAPRWVRDGQE